MTRDAHDSFLRTFSAVPDDKITWRPLGQGRSALDLLGDAAQVTGLAAELAASRGENKPTYEKYQNLKTERAAWTKDDALRVLEANAQKFYSAVAQLSDEELAQPLATEIGGGQTITLSVWLTMVNRSFISRFAQVNYIQTLYGDFDSH